jgi:hypothetical protein
MIVLRRLMGIVVVCLAFGLLAGCGSGAQENATASKASTQAPKKLSADLKACVGVQAVIGHITAGTARWTPDTDPFDRAISKQLTQQAQNLAVQGPQATDPDIQVAVRQTSDAFKGVASAMKSKKRARFDSAIQQSRVAYKKLKAVCSLGNEN